MTRGWLTSNHISAVNKLLRKSFPEQEGLNDTSILAEKLLWPSKPNEFVQIIRVAGYHWACLSNRFCNAGSVELCDSLHTIPATKGQISKQACVILHPEESSIKIDVVNVQLQADDSSCGLFATAMAYDLCRGIDPFVRNYNQSNMYDHLKSCFGKGELTAFPATISNSGRKHQRVVAEVEVPIYCICRLPEREPMACCDACGNWYHQQCVQIPNEVFEDENLLWICDNCKLLCSYAFGTSLIKLVYIGYFLNIKVY